MHIVSRAALFGVAMAAAIVPGTGFASSQVVPGTRAQAPANAPIVSNKHRLLSISIDQGAPAVVDPSGFTTVDATNLTCPDATCTIAVDMAQEAGSQLSASNYWAICAVVDGAYASNGCAYAGELPTDGSYLTGHERQTFSVTKGQHNVSYQIYLVSPATIGIYDVQYSVLTP